MPKYVKFLKEILSNKRKLEDLGLVTLNAECSVVFQSKIPVKRRDLGSFTIPCLIGDKLKLLALADLRASINLMPSSLFEELGLSISKLTPTRMSIQLADRTVKYPKGIIEDVLVKPTYKELNNSYLYLHPNLHLRRHVRWHLNSDEVVSLCF
ncbi:uncharacterized protein LOC125371178 [Ricinus communis]|uniref:uncharacterized protein LOC125371178 n=1 Tax=Ricinus communis TaxID=3988 RepID=UPI00201A7B7B|nr:uncharacterized protein LOC125371178 [Ricinus communis]